LSVGAPPHTPLGELTALLQTPSWILGGVLLKGSGRDERGREGRVGKGEEGRGRGEGRVGPQAKAWPPELFSWRRRWLSRFQTDGATFECSTLLLLLRIQ